MQVAVAHHYGGAGVAAGRRQIWGVAAIEQVRSGGQQVLHVTLIKVALQQPVHGIAMVFLVRKSFGLHRQQTTAARSLGKKVVVVMNNASCVLVDLYVLALAQILVLTRNGPARSLEGPPENLPITR